MRNSCRRACARLSCQTWKGETWSPERAPLQARQGSWLSMSQCLLSTASAARRYIESPIPVTAPPNLTYSTQVLLTGYDFLAPEGPQNFLQTLDCLLGMKVVPILNGNDVHSPPPQRNSDLQDVSVCHSLSHPHLLSSCSPFGWQVVSIPDNDCLSSLVATSTRADLLIFLSDVDGKTFSVCLMMT